MTRVNDAFKRAAGGKHDAGRGGADEFVLERFPGESPAGREAAHPPAPGRGATPAVGEPPDRRLTVHRGPQAAAGDARIRAQCQRLAARLHRQREGAGRGRLLVSGAVDATDVAAVALGLAESLAAHGQRILLIDAGTGAPALHQLLDVPCEPGLTEVLRGTAPLPVLQVDERLHVVCRGQPGATREELSGPRLGNLVDGRRATYDWILLCGSVASADGGDRGLAQLVDGSVLVIGSSTRLPAVEEAMTALARDAVIATVMVGFG